LELKWKTCLNGPLCSIAGHGHPVRNPSDKAARRLREKEKRGDKPPRTIKIEACKFAANCQCGGAEHHHTPGQTLTSRETRELVLQLAGLTASGMCGRGVVDPYEFSDEEETPIPPPIRAAYDFGVFTEDYMQEEERERRMYSAHPEEEEVAPAVRPPSPTSSVTVDDELSDDLAEIVAAIERNLADATPVHPTTIQWLGDSSDDSESEETEPLLREVASEEDQIEEINGVNPYPVVMTGEEALASASLIPTHEVQLYMTGDLTPRGSLGERFGHFMSHVGHVLLGPFSLESRVITVSSDPASAPLEQFDLTLLSNTSYHFTFFGFFTAASPWSRHDLDVVAEVFANTYTYTRRAHVISELITFVQQETKLLMRKFVGSDGRVYDIMSAVKHAVQQHPKQKEWTTNYVLYTNSLIHATNLLLARGIIEASGNPTTAVMHFRSKGRSR
jgi:hypothetical protein